MLTLDNKKHESEDSPKIINSDYTKYKILPESKMNEEDHAFHFRPFQRRLFEQVY